MRPRVFTSTDLDHWFSKLARKMTNQDFSHGGIRWSLDDTFEARIKVDDYRWTDYEKPNMRVNQFEFRRVSDDRLMRAFVDLRNKKKGARYGVGQLLAFVPVLLWRKVGVERDISIRRFTVCSELVWMFIDALGGNHQRSLRNGYPDQDIFTPGDLFEFCIFHPSLFDRV